MFNQTQINDEQLLRIVEKMDGNTSMTSYHSEESGMIKWAREEYDDYNKIQKSREDLIGKFRNIKDQNDRFKVFIATFRENEKEFALKLKTIKIDRHNVI